MGMGEVFGVADDFVLSLPGQPSVAKADLEFGQPDDDEIIQCEIRMRQKIRMIACNYEDPKTDIKRSGLTPCVFGVCRFPFSFRIEADILA
jgi:hypothetical protein